MEPIEVLLFGAVCSRVACLGQPPGYQTRVGSRLRPHCEPRAAIDKSLFETILLLSTRLFCQPTKEAPTVHPPDGPLARLHIPGKPLRVVMIEGVAKAVHKPSLESGVQAARACSAKYARGLGPGGVITAMLLVILCVGCTVEMSPIATVIPSFTPPATETATAAPVTKEVLELAQQYKELRKIKGYFTGGEWNDDVDSSRGRLYTILDELRQALGNPSYKRADIVLLMGEPDAILAHDSKEYLLQRGTPDLAGQGGAEKNLLVYFWRGWHDYVYFVCQDDTIQEAGWYFAFE